MTALFENKVTLRGFLGRDTEASLPNGITADSYAVLTLCTEAGKWVKRDGYWLFPPAEQTIICPGPFFRGLTRFEIHATKIQRLDDPPGQVYEVLDN
jgi:hypothetical protein